MDFSGFFFLSINLVSDVKSLGEMNMKQLFQTIINNLFALENITVLWIGHFVWIRRFDLYENILFIEKTKH